MNEYFDDKLIEQQEEKIPVMPLGLDLIKCKKAKTYTKPIDTSTASYKLKEIIYNKVPKGQEFLTAFISPSFRAMGYKTSDLSGQMHALKNAGYLGNRNMEDEYQNGSYRKGIRIWWATDKLYDFVANCQEQLANNVLNDTEDGVAEQD